METCPALVIYSLKMSELRVFRNKVMRIKSILGRYKGSFVGIAKQVLSLTPEGMVMSDMHFGILFFEKMNECTMFMNSERGFAQMDYIECNFSWIVPLMEPIEFQTLPIVLMMTEIPTLEVIEGLPQSENEMEMASFGARPNIGSTTTIDRIMGTRAPAAMRVTQWRDPVCCHKWMQAESCADVRNAYISMAKTYLVTLTMDYNDD